MSFRLPAVIRDRLPDRNRYLRLVVLLVLAQICALFARARLQLELEGRGIGSAKDLSYLLVPIILCCLLFPVWRTHGQLIRNAFERQNLGWRVAATGVALGVLMRVTYWGALLLIVTARLPDTGNVDHSQAPLVWFSCPSPAVVLLYAIVMAGLTPVIEEALNRGWLLHWLLPYGRWLAIVVSAALFAVFHTWSGILFAFWFGIFAAVYVLNSGHLWGVVIAHATYNLLIAFDWSCLHVVWQPDVQSSSLMIIQVVTAVIVVAATLIAITLVRK